MFLTLGPNSSLPGIDPREIKTYVNKKTCANVSTAILKIIAPRGEQPRCTSVGGWMNKLWSVHSVDGSLAEKGMNWFFFFQSWGEEERERERDRETERQQRETLKQVPYSTWSPTRGSIPQPWDHDLG